MQRPAATHSTHDELLLVRLYGGDVDERERSSALDQMASCEQCADLFADLGAISAATAALPVPPRPRDFTLTEADVAHLGRRDIGRGIFDWLGRTRALGGSMVAAGVIGVVLIGAISAFAPGGSGGGQGTLAVAGPANAAGTSDTQYGVPVPAADQTNPGRKSTGETATTLSSMPSAVPTSPADVTSPKVPSSTGGAQAIASGDTAFGPETGGLAGVPGGVSIAAPTPGSGAAAPPAPEQDSRNIALLAFAGLAFLGVLLLAVPRFAARRARR